MPYDPARKTVSVLDRLLGLPELGLGPKCRVLAKDVSCHWWPADAKEGDPCFCGASKLPKESES